MTALFGSCAVCGAPQVSVIVRTPSGPRSHAVGIACSADPGHGPDIDGES